MAFDFPSNPANGAVYQDYVYDSASGWRSQVMVGAAPCGSIMPFAGATIPAGWLLCDGAAVSRTTYSSLFAALGGISSPWGLGNGSTTFNLPDLRTRVPVGKNSSGTFANLGAIGGAETMSLTEAHLAAHSHTFSATTSTNGNHNHAPRVAVTYGGSAGNYRSVFATNSPFWSLADFNNVVSDAGNHNHTVSGTTSTTGSGAAFGLLQPYAVVNYIIKFSAVVAASDTELAVRMGTTEAAANAATTAVASKAPTSSPTFTGTVRMLDQPSFFVGKGNDSNPGNSNPLIFNATPRFNVGNCYNTSNGRFTAPVAGKYSFHFSGITHSVTNYLYVWFAINGTQISHTSIHKPQSTGEYDFMAMTHILDLAAGDYVTVVNGFNGGTPYFEGGRSGFSGYLVG